MADEPERGLPPRWEAVQRARQLGDGVVLGESPTQYLMCDALLDPAHAEPLFTEATACTQQSEPGAVRASPGQGHGAQFRRGPRPGLWKGPPKLIFPRDISARLGYSVNRSDHNILWTSLRTLHQILAP